MRRDFPYKLLIRKKWKTRFTTGYIILVNIQNTLDTRSDIVVQTRQVSTLLFFFKIDSFCRLDVDVKMLFLVSTSYLLI